MVNEAGDVCCAPTARSAPEGAGGAAALGVADRSLRIDSGFLVVHDLLSVRRKSALQA
eukprot:CAMPEP_0172672806 /NCGR_PEP_ID=MMETSP1074-20121228/11769_1 /TAXON_ID=2916 /ORGANISM="Ceratium fusus, Strain PA161109" /LENGTH=57 /DNA_ID=CAMNT_0013490037 /DNA_START=44 /DNA_END=213 /DNA_ORIENTATION=+